MVAPDRERLRAALLRQRATAPGLRDFLRARLRPASPQPVALPAGEVLRFDCGTCWRRVLRYPFDHRHGEVRLGDALDLDPDRLAALWREPVPARCDAGQWLLLDTETTGLGGAGTVVFALGLGWFEPECLVLEQLFLRDFGEEPAMLTRFAEVLAEHPVPVTFVGKSFDRHRIAARLSVCRLTAPILSARHLDLYHAARRVFGRRLPDCRLRTIEERELGVYRSDDLPGSEAPAAFLDWIHDRSGPVDRVLEHNRLDVLSLAALLAVLARAAGR